MEDPGYSQEAYQQTEELANKWYSLHYAAENALESMGFTHPARPEFTCPILDPKALTTADLPSYAEMHARFQRWHNYAEDTLARIKSCLLGVKRQIEQLESTLHVMYADVKNPNTGKPYTIADRKDLTKGNPRYVELLQEETKLRQMEIEMEAHVNGLSKSTALISRHIELRKLDIEGDRIGHNMPGRGMYVQR